MGKLGEPRQVMVGETVVIRGQAVLNSRDGAVPRDIPAVAVMAEMEMVVELPREVVVAVVVVCKATVVEVAQVEALVF